MLPERFSVIKLNVYICSRGIKEKEITDISGAVYAVSMLRALPWELLRASLLTSYIVTVNLVLGLGFHYLSYN
jgi:hypothetical protein